MVDELLEPMMARIESALQSGDLAAPLANRLREWCAGLMEYADGAPEVEIPQIAREGARLDHILSVVEEGMAESALHPLISEATGLLGLTDVDFLVMAGFEPEPLTILLPPDGPPHDVAIILDGTTCSMEKEAPGVVLHETAHAHSDVDRHCSRPRAHVKKQGEGLADSLALALGGSGFTRSLSRLYHASGRDLESQHARHPSFATRGEFLTARAHDLWNDTYGDEVVSSLAPLAQGKSEPAVLESLEKAVTHVVTTMETVKIQAADVYAERTGQPSGSPRVALSAAEGNK